MTKTAMKGAFLLLLFMMLFSGSALADTITSYSLRIQAGSVVVTVQDGQAGVDRDARAGYVSYQGIVGGFFISSATMSSVVSGTDVILTLGGNVGHFGGAAETLILTATATNAMGPKPIDLFLGDVTSTMTLGSGTFQSQINGGNNLFGPSGVTLGAGTLSASANPVATPNIESPFTQTSTATLVFPSGGGSANFTFRSVADPRPETASDLPEPLSLLLLGSGLIGVGLLRRKSGKNA